MYIFVSLRMNREQMIDRLRTLQLSANETQAIRQQIQAKRSKKLFLRKMRYYIRISAYTGVSVFAIFLLFSSYQPSVLERQENPITDTIVSVNPIGAPFAEASVIGTLVEVQGVAHVISNGVIVPSADIRLGELVVLQPGAEVIVQVRQQLYAKVVWPAKFVFESHPNGSATFILNLLEGEYIEILTASEDSEPSPRTDIQPEETIVIKTKYVEVSTQDQPDTHFSITQTDDNAEVVSNDGDLVVKQLVLDNEQQEISVKSGQTVRVSQTEIDMSTPTSQEDITQLTLNSKQLHIRYVEEPENKQAPSSLSSIDAQTSEEDQWAVDTLAELGIVNSTDNSDGLDPSIFDALAGTAENSIDIIDPQLLVNLTQTLHPDITRHNSAQMRQWIDAWNTNALLIAYSNLLQQIDRAYQLIGKSQPRIDRGIDSFQAGITVATQLRTILTSSYTTPPSLLASIDLIIAELSDLQQTSHKSSVIDEISTIDAETWSDIQEATPLDQE